MSFVSFQSFKTGLKMLVAGLPSAVLGVLGIALLRVLITSLQDIALLWVSLILWIPLSVMITGWCATKLWRWK